ncbi:MAG TPA: zinc-dependent alcohol dehydrogenase family protein [Flavisolibacter sp.]|nr:zinc-dependent alcohol dehydrogenase family protein [Flavisolibacter sp.]
MKAISFHRTGPLNEVLCLEEVPVPIPKENEVLIKVLASSINPADALFVEGRYRLKPEVPQIAGLEGAGIVVQRGENVRITPGTLVSFRAKNVWADYVVVPEEKLYVLPSDFPVEKAAQFSLNPITAWALLQEAQVKAGDWLLLTAGASAVSKQIIQLAKRQGVKVIAVIRSHDSVRALEELQADAIINSEEVLLSEQVALLTDGLGVTAALDAVGGSTGVEVVKSAAMKATIVLYGMLSQDLVCYHNADVVLKLLTIKGFGLDNWLASQTRQQKQAMVAALVSLLVEPDFQMPVTGSFPLEEFRQAIQNSQIRQGRGKTLFIF